MDDKKIEEYEELLKNRHVERNYNFFKPVGQFIEHVDTINFSMDKDGTFHFVMKDRATGLFSIQKTFSANDLAHIVDMPLWEVVGIDTCGCDELAILFFEEN